MKKLCVFASLILLIGMGSFYAQNTQTIVLPAPQTEIGKPLMQVLQLRHSTREFDSRLLPLQELSNLLWAGCGINRPESGKRTAPSAMNYQEIDVYVVLPDDAYLYDAKSHSLIPVATGDIRKSCGMQDYVFTAPLNLIYVADFSKMGNMPMEEKEKSPYPYSDAAFVAGNVYLYCASENLAAVVRAYFDQAKLAEALKLRSDQKVVLTQTVGYPK